MSKTGTLLVALLLAAPAAARWDVVLESPADTSAPIEIALVTNEEGHDLRVYRDDAGTVLAVFSIRAGFDTLSDAQCPTFQIDDHAPIALGDVAHCALDAKRARFALGAVDEGVIRSNALLDLMNGSRIAFRYRMPSLGYRETSFSLRGSKHSLNRAIGTDIVVVEE